jgi:APA family basic amino acid/polyamine antiporter
VNYFGIRWGARVQNVFTAAKLLGVAVLIGSAWFAPVAPSAAPATVTAPAFGVALIACLMAFEGWSYLSFIAGEVRDPQRNLLRAVAIGLGVCAAIYLLANAAYLRVLTIDELTASPRPGALAAERTLGSSGGAFVTLVILIAIVGSANGQLLAPARVYFAQAHDGLFFRRFAEVHPRYGSPHWALLGVALWSATFLLTNAWQTLLNYAIFSNWLIVVGVIGSLIALRRRQPDLPRPFRMWGYPVTAYLFLALAVAFCANTLIERPRDSMVSLALILAGVPVFYVTLGRWTRS